MAIKPGAVFERREKKYVLTEAQWHSMMKRIAPYTQQDEYGLHTILSLYFDTVDYALIRNCLEKPALKQKLRLRSYGTPNEEEKVFLELKKKYQSVSYKRRISLPLAQARAYLQQDIKPAKKSSGQIFEEIDWFVHHYALMPRVLVSYDRIALFGLQDAQLRITFDQRIRWREEELDLAKGDSGRLLLDAGLTVMEVKASSAMPLWLCEALTKAKAYPQSLSKYGAIYNNHIAHRREMIYV